MTQTVCIVGVSGVGKSTFINSLKTQIECLHLSAGEIIKSQKEVETSHPQDHDQLRRHDINDNQRLLITGFQNRVATNNNIVLLDGHTVIDTSDKLLAIPTDVFDQLAVKAFVYIQDEPQLIVQRRASDQSRDRPQLSEAVIKDHQNFAILTTSEISREMRVPMLLVTPDETNVVMDFLRN